MSFEQQLYSVALDHQLDMLRHLASQGLYDFEGGTAWVQGADQHVVEVKGLAQRDVVEQGLAKATRVLRSPNVYYWSRDMLTLVEQAANSLPEQAGITPDMVPVRDVYMYFQEPVDIPSVPELDSYISGPVKAVGWVAIPDGMFVLLIRIAPNGPARGVLGGSYWWHWDNDPRVFAINNRADFNRFHQILVSMLLFMQQEILESPAKPVDRAARRRVTKVREYDGEPCVRVVRLRKVKHTDGTETGEHEGREWHCQWIVSGHWRQQVCGTGRSLRRPTWIRPYIKGPDDQPLKPQAKRLVAVVR
jgi:hypothetical protein